MKEYKWSVGLRRKATGARLSVHVWAPTNDEATHKLCGVLIGPECDYEWTGTGPVYENNQTVERDAAPQISKGGTHYMKTPVLNIAPGKVVSYRGEPCIVLEHRQDGTLLLGVEYVEHTFGSSNNFAASSLRQHLNSTFLDCITQNNPDEIITRTVDLTALNGSKEYGTCEAKVAPLTLDELRKYHDIIPKPEVWEWSATPWSTPKVNEDDRWVLGLYSNGNLNGNVCSNTYGSRPAFLIPSTLTIEVEDEEPANPLEQYSTNELVAEVNRRMNE